MSVFPCFGIFCHSYYLSNRIHHIPVLTGQKTANNYTLFHILRNNLKEIISVGNVQFVPNCIQHPTMLLNLEGNFLIGDFPCQSQVKQIREISGTDHGMS